MKTVSIIGLNFREASTTRYRRHLDFAYEFSGILASTSAFHLQPQAIPGNLRRVVWFTKGRMAGARVVPTIGALLKADSPNAPTICWG